MGAVSKPARGPLALLARWIEPVDMLAEAIYSVLIVMTFTMAFNAFGGGSPVDEAFDRVRVSQLLGAALGCAFAWGLIDGVMYILTSLFERAEEHRLARAVQAAAGGEQAFALISAELDPRLARITSDEERRSLYSAIGQRIAGLTIAPARITGDDLLGALATVLVAVLAALPATIPFLFINQDPYLALRVSNAISVFMLFWLGWRWGRYLGSHPLWTGLSLAALGVVMVLVAIPLGG
jgi:hypothetical protein